MNIRVALLILFFLYWHFGFYPGLAVVALALCWPLLRIAAGAWLAGYFGGKGLRAAIVRRPQHRRLPRCGALESFALSSLRAGETFSKRPASSPFRVPPPDYYNREPGDMPTPRRALRAPKRRAALPPPAPFDDEMPF
jgi:hypothetical protein